MHRDQFRFLDDWLAAPNRKPLIIRGARQVGKSTLVRLFAERCGRPLVEVNLERHPDLGPAFARNDPAYLLNVLEALPGVGPIGPDGLLFLDEIQAVPESIPALRYFREDIPELPVLAAGSLLDFALANHASSMPVGRIGYLHMGPMTFTEHLEAVGAEGLAHAIRTFEMERRLDPAIHNRLMAALRTYFFTGGMPEAVQTFAHSGRLRDITEVHNSIIDTYREDFPKYVGSQGLAGMVNVFNFAARNVGRKVKYVQFSKEDSAAATKARIELLCMARVLAKVVRSHCNGLPLQAEADLRAYKLLFMDVGLMNAVCGLGWTAIERMNQTGLVNEGATAEQFIGQHLQALLATSANRELSYWLREGRSANAEVDYVTAFDGRIVPIEVKAGASGGLKSLHQFVAEKGAPLAVRFDATLPLAQQIRTRVQRGGKQTEAAYRLISLPLYLVEQLPTIIANA
ncbi:MAG: ATP-binding protein [Gammaproteobacteria bacterium]|nr:ATP-binding protein [Gammaproteobacteria bacterium]